MKVGLITVAYRERRFIRKFIKHIPQWVDRKVVLLSEKPWYGEDVANDGTYDAVKSTSAIPIQSSWTSEEQQRNSGLSLLEDCDWVLVLDPDEFLSDNDWFKLREHLARSSADALVCKLQKTYWKKGWVAVPPEGYRQIIAVRPHVQFADKRVVNCGYESAPVTIHHFSWARTDEEVWTKISHYAHAVDFDIKQWYDEVWLKWQPGMQDVHPTTPSALHDFEPATLPKELEDLKLWPPN